jgi:hypothetical protein
MTWSGSGGLSKVFPATLTDMFNNLIALDADGDAWKAALFNDSVTPSQTVTSANAAYNAGVWNANGVSDATGWPAVGRPVTPITSSFLSNVYTLDAPDTVSANGTTTITNAFGDLFYDDTLTAGGGPADQALAFHYFGGATSVSSGTFTIAWNALGIVQLTA